MAIEISLIYLYRVLWWRMFAFIIVIFYSFTLYRIFTEYANLNPFPPQKKKKKTLFITSHNSLCMSV